MFCPNCKAEYRPGFIKCSDCNELLVDKLPAEEPKNTHRSYEAVNMVKVYEAYSEIDVSMVSSLLTEQGIHFFVESTYTLSGVVGPKIFKVPANRLESAKEVIACYKS